MTEPPAPLIASDIDLRDFPYMPLDVVRLRDSEITAIVSGEAFRAAVILWCVAWHQLPAASLPSDDRALARMAGFGRDLDGWNAIKAEALHGFVLCSDGRYYHPVIAEKARDAWEAKKAQRARTAAATAARAAKHAPPHDNRHEEQDAKRDDDRNVNRDEQRDDDRNVHQGRVKGREREIDKQETRERASDGLPSQKPAKEKTPRKHPFPADAFDRWYAGYPHKVGKDAAKRAFAKVVSKDTVAFETLVDRLADYIRAKPIDRPWCNPATWLNEGRWADEPASRSSTAPPPRGDPGTTIDFGNGCSAPRETIRKIWGTGRWPPDWGAPPGQPGCRIPSETIAEIMGERAA